jgi:hypothetical protein
VTAELQRLRRENEILREPADPRLHSPIAEGCLWCRRKRMRCGKREINSGAGSS